VLRAKIKSPDLSGKEASSADNADNYKKNVFIRANPRYPRTKFFGATATLYSIATPFRAWSALENDRL
jgi:hypothetical protein